MKSSFIIAVMAIAVVLLPLASTSPITAQQSGRALILSSIENSQPMGYKNTITRSLVSAGYEVTVLDDASVTLNVLTTQLNNYDVVIWRTGLYGYSHTLYWYVGERDNATVRAMYAPDFASGSIDNTYGVLGVNLDFFRNHFKAGTLGNVKLAVLASRMSLSFAQMWVEAGAKATIDFYGASTPSYGEMDYVVAQIIRNLADGSSVKTSILKTISRFYVSEDGSPLDPRYLPPVWYLGDGTVTIAYATLREAPVRRTRG